MTFVLSTFASSQQILKSKSAGVTDKEIEFLVIYFYVYLVLAFVSIIFFVWAMKKWKKNQEKLDVILDTELKIKLSELHKNKSKKSRKK